MFTRNIAMKKLFPLILTFVSIVAYGQGKKEISILGDAGAFFYKHQIQSLLDYESILPLNFDINLKGICMYHQKDFNKMSKDFQEKILKRHSMAIMI